MRVFVTSLGCKLNQAEVEDWTRRLEGAGHQVVERVEDSELQVVNSCAVTAEAVRDSERAVRRGRAVGLTTVLTGCAASGPLAERAHRLGVDRVVSNAEKDQLPELLGLVAPPAESARSSGRSIEPRLADRLPVSGPRARATLKVEDGCSMGCAFCIIPATRGVERSRSAAVVLNDLVELESRGFAEVVVTGVQISSYRDGSLQLGDLVGRMLAATRDVRLRLTSIAPWQLDERLFALLRHPRLCRHVHLSLQSGSAATLRRMRRPDRPERFARVVERLRAEVPGIAVTSDVIVGFPGEDESEFRDSLAFVRAMGFARLHVFPYSERPGTTAESLPDPVPVAVRKARVERMREAAAEGAAAFLAARVGGVEAVLWEGRRRGRWLGTSDTSIRVAMPVDRAEGLVRGAIATVRIAGVEGGLALGVPFPRHREPGVGAATRP